ncbi:hypothetical protein BN2476_590108 [Paraburkholderia piptadeniae]|uniref:Uncharacterized protein n=1 Tax=Paraburkholderia piptadeniae TaxID=1701573 RepID=A0A1N7SK93_9BURK|nr:hypothetical protein BN2476_590108 [Paraburkholderia piptadeniae]
MSLLPFASCLAHLHMLHFHTNGLRIRTLRRSSVMSIHWYDHLRLIAAFYPHTAAIPTRIGCATN